MESPGDLIQSHGLNNNYGPMTPKVVSSVIQICFESGIAGYLQNIGYMLWEEGYPRMTEDTTLGVIGP